MRRCNLCFFWLFADAACGVATPRRRRALGMVPTVLENTFVAPMRDYGLKGVANAPL